MKKLMIAVALTTALVAAQARSAVALIEPSRVSVAVESADKLKAAIVRGGASHQWTVRSEAPGKLTLQYVKQNKHEVVVDIIYDATGYQIRYVSSLNMKFEQDGGLPMIHPYYNKWVGTLSQSILNEVRVTQGARLVADDKVSVLTN